MKIAILLTCYNRKEKTLKCLTTLFNQIYAFGNEIFKIYICDDNSTDGTYEAISEQFPEVFLMKSIGNLYWCKGMHEVMQVAFKDKHEMYLMINDDVDFSNNMIDIMLNNYMLANCDCGIIGSTKSLIDKSITYGGRVDKNSLKLISPSGILQRCELANWNCFLIPHNVIEMVGFIDRHYEHSFGDFDYSIRMSKSNIPIFVAGEYIGYCERNAKKGTYKDENLNCKTRLKHLISPKGMPIYSYFRFNVHAFGFNYLGKSIIGYLSLIIYILFNKEIK